jgi:hypothetical protein
VREIVARLRTEARQFLNYWAALPAHEFVPRRRSFDPMAIARILPVVSLLQRVDDDDWRFRLVGTEIDRRWARSLTGMSHFRVDIISPRAAETMRREFRQIVERPCGSWSQRAARLQSGRTARIETLRLPLRADDDGITLIVSCCGEVSGRLAAIEDATCEIIRITQQQFVDIGAGRPPATVLGDAPEDPGSPSGGC